MEGVRQSPTDPDFVQNPYPFYARARGTGGYRVLGGVRDSRRHQPPRGHFDPEGSQDGPRAARTARHPAASGGRSTRSRRIRCWNSSRHAIPGSAASSCALSPRAGSPRSRPRRWPSATALIDGFPDGPFDLLQTYAQRLAGDRHRASSGRPRNHVRPASCMVERHGRDVSGPPDPGDRRRGRPRDSRSSATSSAPTFRSGAPSPPMTSSPT